MICLTMSTMTPSGSSEKIRKGCGVRSQCFKERREPGWTCRSQLLSSNSRRPAWRELRAMLSFLLMRAQSIFSVPSACQLTLTPPSGMGIGSVSCSKKWTAGNARETETSKDGRACATFGHEERRRCKAAWRAAWRAFPA